MLTPEQAWDKYNAEASKNLTDIQYGDVTDDKDDKAVPALWAQQAMFKFTWALCQQELSMQLNIVITLVKESVDVISGLNRSIELLDELNRSFGEPIEHC